MIAGGELQAWRQVMAAYRRVYDTRHLHASDNSYTSVAVAGNKRALFKDLLTYQIKVVLYFSFSSK